MATVAELQERLDAARQATQIAELEAEIATEEARLERAVQRGANVKRRELMERVRPVDARRFKELVGIEFMASVEAFTDGTADSDTLAGMAWMMRRVEETEWDDWEWAQTQPMGDWMSGYAAESEGDPGDPS